jgi:hypothetical protein
VFGRRSNQGILLSTAVRQFLTDAGNNEVAVPIGHAVDPDHEATRRETPEAAIAFDQRHFSARPCGGHGCCKAGGTPSHDQYLAYAVNLDFTGRFWNRFAFSRSHGNLRSPTPLWHAAYVSSRDSASSRLTNPVRNHALSGFLR